MRWGSKEATANWHMPAKADSTSPWTEVELATLRQMRADGLSARLISQMLNRTQASVNDEIKRLCAPRCRR
jgi:IS30 family transposase